MNFDKNVYKNLKILKKIEVMIGGIHNFVTKLNTKMDVIRQSHSSAAHIVNPCPARPGYIRF